MASSVARKVRPPRTRPRRGSTGIRSRWTSHRRGTLQRAADTSTDAVWRVATSRAPKASLPARRAGTGSSCPRACATCMAVQRSPRLGDLGAQGRRRWTVPMRQADSGAGISRHGVSGTFAQRATPAPWASRTGWAARSSFCLRHVEPVHEAVAIVVQLSEQLRAGTCDRRSWRRPGHLHDYAR